MEIKMKALTILLLATALISHSQSPTIKGHTLGETTQQFTANVDDLSRRLINQCTAMALNNVHTSQGIDCGQFLQILKTGSGALNCTDPAYKMGMCRNFGGTVKFVAGKVVEFRITIMNTSWDDALGDSITKFGKPVETHTSIMQNGYGATFDLQVANWTTPGYMADLCEVMNDNLNKSSSLHLVDRAYYDSEHKPHSSVLD